MRLGRSPRRSRQEIIRRPTRRDLIVSTLPRLLCAPHFLLDPQPLPRLTRVFSTETHVTETRTIAEQPPTCEPEGTQAGQLVTAELAKAREECRKRVQELAAEWRAGNRKFRSVSALLSSPPLFPLLTSCPIPSHPPISSPTNPSQRPRLRPRRRPPALPPRLHPPRPALQALRRPARHADLRPPALLLRCGAELGRHYSERGAWELLVLVCAVDVRGDGRAGGKILCGGE